MHRSKFVLVFIAITLILALALPACTCGTTPALAPTPAPGKVSFTAATYEDTVYNFSVQYPKEWAKMSAKTDTVLFAAQASTQALVVIVAAVKAASAKDAAIAAMGEFVKAVTGSFDPKAITGFTAKDGKLADGTACSDAEVQASISGFPVKSFASVAPKGDKCIVILVAIVDIMSPYNAALYGEIAHSIAFKK